MYEQKCHSITYVRAKMSQQYKCTSKNVTAILTYEQKCHSITNVRAKMPQHY